MNRLNRRQVVATGIGGLFAGVSAKGAESAGETADMATNPESPMVIRPGTEARALFPRLEHDTFLNAAGGTPRGSFHDAGRAQFDDNWKLGPDEGRRERFNDAITQVRERFARLIGARTSEIAFVSCTKDGEQTVLEGTPSLWQGTGNVVTNDLHFSGSLHNLLGLRSQGLDVRVVKSRDWAIDPEEMIAAMDDRTALVSITLVSNINGHIEDVRVLSDAAHARGAHIYVDIIQAAGCYPIDVEAMGIDYAACSGYKWLFGTHGAGFLYVRQELQGTALQDRLFPGYAQATYAPWVPVPETAHEQATDDFTLAPLNDARRYQPGHPSYIGLCILNEGLAFIEHIGVEAARAHAVYLNQRLLGQVDGHRFRSISPHVARSPIVTLRTDVDISQALREARIFASFGRGRLRVSPSAYNTEDDIERLAEVLSKS